ncbi:MAG TPA: dienelactone hydrolase family protein [Gemmatales bacterium]|nr:dienelactone hydrolase family protein [Gemmatales bacterium]HMP58500.1 dienelactone hydrolase family protein [Gemmatales bacterium]
MPRSLLAVCTFLVLGIEGPVQAGIKTEVVEYRHGDVVLEGYLAYDEDTSTKRPGVLIVHEWFGHNGYARQRAEQLAASGYVAFALDMYGKGVLAKTNEEAAQMSNRFRTDRQLMRDRAAAGLAVLQQHAAVAPGKIAAIGYCFGGTVALELARGGAHLAGVVSFHGGLNTPRPEDARNIKGRLLILHGADDPFVPETEVAAFIKEMRAAQVDWQMVSYGGAVHSFTNPDAGTNVASGAAYNEKADQRSYLAMLIFFNELFADKK